jgi:hypothetical protein
VRWESTQSDLITRGTTPTNLAAVHAHHARLAARFLRVRGAGSAAGTPPALARWAGRAGGPAAVLGKRALRLGGSRGLALAARAAARRGRGLTGRCGAGPHGSDGIEIRRVDGGGEPEGALDLAHLLHLLAGDERDDEPGRPGPAGAARAVDVVLVGRQASKCTTQATSSTWMPRAATSVATSAWTRRWRTRPGPALAGSGCGRRGWRQPHAGGELLGARRSAPRRVRVNTMAGHSARPGGRSR